ncbi:MAG: cob(I)yrinic acid a,c-diamide adenosyltransferase, partial [Alphaproteobacteria bacterium]
MGRIKAARERMMAGKTAEKGLLVVHTGKGKGKSSSAFGMVMRCLGHGMRVGIVQFIKGAWETGEANFLKRFPEQVGGGGEAHVGDVARAQVDLGGRARTLDQHEVGVAREPRPALHHAGEQRRLERVIVARRGVADDAALDDHLRADLALRLEQHGVHVGVRRHAAGARLQR